ncbi:MAG TPA: tetratricopeptide repeat protein, partial [Polyangia bacterium]|nr:tetratricopeptide repeat protein [Polyangia bacterium]
LGVAKSKTDDRDGAIAALRKAITLRPDDADLHFDLAVVFRRERKTDEAIAEYRLALDRDPKLAKAYYDLGIMYSQEKKAAAAKEAFENYLKNGAGEDAASRKDAEDRLKTFKDVEKSK